MQEQMRKLLEKSHTKSKSKKSKKKDPEDGTTRATPSQPKNKKKPIGEVKSTITDSVSASISNVVSLIEMDLLTLF